ncbi:4Fe-4S binding protein [Chloroflexota bacterium]
MYTITRDRSRCKKDGICTRVCPTGIFIQGEKNER